VFVSVIFSIEPRLPSKEKESTTVPFINTLKDAEAVSAISFDIENSQVEDTAELRPVDVNVSVMDLPAWKKIPPPPAPRRPLLVVASLLGKSNDMVAAEAGMLPENQIKATARINLNLIFCSSSTKRN